MICCIIGVTLFILAFIFGKISIMLMNKGYSEAKDVFEFFLHWFWYNIYYSNNCLFNSYCNCKRLRKI